MNRSPSLLLDEYHDMSSPDPLATSLNDENDYLIAHSPSPAKFRERSPARYVQVLEDITIITPQKAARNNRKPLLSPNRTVSEQTLSPWKIRVTVEAEPEDAGLMQRTTTRTVKVPLRQSSSPAQNMDTGRRGRISEPVSGKQKRDGTPLRTRSTSRSRRQSVTDLDIVVLGDDADSDDWTKRNSPKKRRGRPKKKVGSGRRQESDDKNVASAEDAEADVQGQRRSTRNKKQFEIREDSDVEEAAKNPALLRPGSPELRKIDLNRVSVRPRSLSTRQKALPTYEHKDGGLLHVPSPMEDGTRKVSHTSAGSYPTPESSVQDEGDSQKSSDPTENHEGFDTILESEGFTMIDLESIPSARNFLSSPSEKQPNEEDSSQKVQTPANKEQLPHLPMARSTPKDLAPVSQPRARPTPIPSYLMLQEGESDISSNVPSSPPVTSRTVSPLLKLTQLPQKRHITPPTYSSPKLPSLPKPLSPESLPIEKVPPKTLPFSLGKVVNAGIALQGVLSPKPNPSISTRTPSLLNPNRHGSTPMERLDDLFDGFDSGTRRELRAGLRFGEELAKRQKSSPMPQQQQQPSTQVWRGEIVVHHTPVTLTAPVKSANTDIPEKWTNPEIIDITQDTERQKGCGPRSGKTSAVESTPTSQTTQAKSPTTLNTQAMREREWQLEREAISREIENANESKVIVIDSDDEDDITTVKTTTTETEEQSDIDEGDLWLEEAEACNWSSSDIKANNAQNKSFSQESQQRQRERAKEALNKPRRTLIPSPWKRGQDVAEASTFLTNGDMSGLFWQPPRGDVKFGSAEIERTKRSLSRSETSRSDENQQDESEAQSSDVDDEKEENQQERSFDDESGVPEQSMLDAQLESPDTSANGGEEGLNLNAFAPRVEHSVTDNESANEPSLNESSLPPRPIKIPVNFNDSSLSMCQQPDTVQCSAPCLAGSGESTPTPPPRPATPPRSAMKGARQSFGLGLELTESPGARKVEFAERRKFLDEHGSEGTESVRSDMSMSVRNDKGFEAAHGDVEKPEDEQPKPKTVGGLFGLFETKPPLDSTPTSTIPAVNNSQDPDSGPPEPEQEWEAARAAIPSTRLQPTASLLHPSKKKRNTPSYLTPPSYPSDPHRDPTVPLTTSGEFSNTHFRTLHIIHAKSSRLRFHAPSFKECRSGLRELFGEKFAADETESGMGTFEWAVGEREVRVVERFMEEVEFGHLVKDVEWGWSEREIVGWLFRIVVGEVVRKEEGSKHRS